MKSTPRSPGIRGLRSKVLGSSLAVAAMVAAPLAVVTAGGAAANTQSATITSSAVASSQSGEPSRARAEAAGDAVARLGIGRLQTRQYERYDRARTAKGSGDLLYMRYTKSFRGIPVWGADAIVTANHLGTVLNTTAPSATSARVDSVVPRVLRPAATRQAKARLAKVSSAKRPVLMIHTFAGKSPRLAWKTSVKGTLRNGNPSVQDVFTDARTGRLLESVEYVRMARGNGHHNGTVDFTTSGSSGNYSMTSTAAPGLKCGNQSGTTYTDSDNVWGNGSGTDLVTACVDAMYAGEQMSKMLRDWTGRNGVNGTGGHYPSRVGLAQVNAYWNGSFANFGRNSAGTKQATSIDVVAHEYGHGVFQFSGGYASSGIAGGMNESTGDILGNATEFYANNPNDPGDGDVGEKIDLSGDGPIRYMNDPSRVGDPNCASQVTNSTEVHSGAGPQNHWFYLLAFGNNPTNGLPSSPLCSGNTGGLTGIGVAKALNIFMSGLQQKTSAWNHANARIATLNAAKNLYPGSCVEFNAVKTAWAGAGQGTVSGEPSCSGTTNDFSISVSPSSGTVTGGSQVTTQVSTSTVSGAAQSVSLSATGLPSGATATFSPTTVTSGGSSTLTIRTSSTTPSGSYNITITGTGSVTKTVRYTLGVNATPNPDPGPGGAPDVNLANVQSHLSQLQSIATSAGGNRRAGTTGYTNSLSYVESKLQAAGFTTTRQYCSTCYYASYNLIADWPGGDPNKTYLFGAHLDSVSAGPGSNDNGSGSAAILEAALAIAAKRPTMDGHLRFAWWTDEEQGLNGSEFYVNNLTSTQRSQIRAYYNFDMVASTNGGYFINNISSVQSAPMKEFFTSLNKAPEENVEGRGRSDDYSFSSNGIPASGFATGASDYKTASQASKWGGTSGRSYDPCYHTSCDSYPSNINATLLNHAADGIAYVAWKQTVGGSSTPAPTPTPDPTPTTDPTPTSTPTPTPTTSPTECSQNSGSAYIAQGSYANTNSFYTSGGTIKACLTGPSGTDFDLYLQKLSGTTWYTVARSERSSSTENISYYATSGSYRLRVYAYYGSGTLQLKWDVP